MCPKYVTVLCATTLFFSTFELSLKAHDAHEKAQEISKLRLFIQAQKFREAQILLRDAINNLVQLDEAEMLAKDLNFAPLQRALNFARKVYTKKLANMGIGELSQVAFFIETSLSSYVQKKEFYLLPSMTGLKVCLEYDPQTQKAFILLDGKDAYIGAGKKKIVKKAILYDGQRPELLARAEQSIPMEEEFAITKLLQGMPGIMDTRAFTQHKQKGTLFTTIYTKLYTGSLQDVFDKKMRLSLYEKMKMGLNILRGLNSLHSNGIVHRDLGARNYLVSIPRGNPDRRSVEAVIADLGRASYLKNVTGGKSNGNTSYIPPEGMFPERMKGQACLQADIFAVGSVFYELFFEKTAPWREMRYFKDNSMPATTKFQSYVKQLDSLTKAKREALKQKKEFGSITPQEQFEYLILRMVDSQPQNRGDAQTLVQEMEVIIPDIPCAGTIR